MSDLLGSVNQLREDKIATHYRASLEEIRAKVEAEPLRTRFEIYAGCPTHEITKEVCHRLNQDGFKAKVMETGWVFTTWYLAVKVRLPDSLVHSEEDE